MVVAVAGPASAGECLPDWTVADTLTDADGVVIGHLVEQGEYHQIIAVDEVLKGVGSVEAIRLDDFDARDGIAGVGLHRDDYSLLVYGFSERDGAAVGISCFVSRDRAEASVLADELGTRGTGMDLTVIEVDLPREVTVASPQPVDAKDDGAITLLLPVVALVIVAGAVAVMVGRNRSG